MRYVEGYKGGYLSPYFSICLFAGLRPDAREGEMAKLREEHFNFANYFIHIEPEVSKVNEKRTVTIQPNLKAWLDKYPLNKYPIVPAHCKIHIEHIRREYSLTADVLRHTYISMLVGKFRSIGDAALQAGNSESMIRKHYLDVKSVEESEKFWGILPL